VCTELAAVIAIDMNSGTIRVWWNDGPFIQLETIRFMDVASLPHVPPTENWFRRVPPVVGWKSV
jgi:hypothetical protein